MSKGSDVREFSLELADWLYSEAALGVLEQQRVECAAEKAVPQADDSPLPDFLARSNVDEVPDYLAKARALSRDLTQEPARVLETVEACLFVKLNSGSDKRAELVSRVKALKPHLDEAEIESGFARLEEIRGQLRTS